MMMLALDWWCHHSDDALLHLTVLIISVYSRDRKYRTVWIKMLPNVVTSYICGWTQCVQSSKTSSSMSKMLFTAMFSRRANTFCLCVADLLWNLISCSHMDILMIHRSMGSAVCWYSSGTYFKLLWDVTAWTLADRLQLNPGKTTVLRCAQRLHQMGII